MKTLLELEKHPLAGEFESISHNEEVLLAFPAGRHALFRQKPEKVSVCVPVYNAEKNLKRCLNSIVTQNFNDFRVLIVDNNSDDGTLRIACTFAAENPNVIVYQNPRNIGRVPNWNRAIELAGGQYLKFVMANDYLLPDNLAYLSQILDDNLGVVVARASLSLLQPDGSLRFDPLFPENLLLSGEEAIRYSLERGNIGAGPTAQLLRRSVIEKHQLRFDTAFSWAADFDFVLQMLTYQVVFRKQCFCLYRLTIVG